jgi:Phage Mu protein F like protein
MATEKTFAPIRPAVASRVKYERALLAAVDEMASSIGYWLQAAYRANEPATVGLAQDADPVAVLQTAFDTLARRWLGRFDALGPKLAAHFARSHKNRVDRALAHDLRQSGFTVKFQTTKAMRDAYAAVIDENVGLIRSIAEQHLAGVRTVLMQSVQTGRDIGALTKYIEKRTGVTKRRAAFIARDQNNKATAVMVRTRALELGVTRARWLHSAGGKEPRPDHVAFSNAKGTFDLAKGHDFDNGEGVVWPGTAINCRCVALPIIPGFDSVTRGPST